MKRTYVWDEETKQMVEKSTLRGERFHTVMGDLAPVVSPIDGRVITDRGEYRRFLKKHDLCLMSEMEGVPERARAERAKREAADRKRAVIDSFEHVRNQERARQRFG